MVDVELMGITKKFGRVTAVSNVSLSVNQGEFVTLVGPSGCGKTTILRIIAGFTKLDKGSVYIKGIKVNDVPPYHRNIGMVFQNYALWRHLTVYENVAFGLKIRKMKEKEVRNRVERALELVRLSGFEERLPQQ